MKRSRLFFLLVFSLALNLASLGTLMCPWITTRATGVKPWPLISPIISAPWPRTRGASSYIFLPINWRAD